MRMAAGFLAGEEPASELGAAAALPPAWGETAMTSNYAHALLDRAEQRFRGSEEPLALIEGDEQGEYLGLVGAAWKLVRGRPTHEVLAEALEQLDKDRSFDFRAEDDTYTELDRWVGGEIDFIVAGHTHLERALRRRSANGWYFNSGTWARLIKLEADVRGSPDKFKAVFDAFKGGTMAALDAHPGAGAEAPYGGRHQGRRQCGAWRTAPRQSAAGPAGDHGGATAAVSPATDEAAMRTTTLELLRHGPSHNQLLSPLTQYLALCENHAAVTVHLPFEHNQFLHLAARPGLSSWRTNRASSSCATRPRCWASCWPASRG
ncbi:MAG: hypothetical protein MZW92_15480 [Comamonadaceae bacterium]|nr:hypothetical protein [Comamonadaceae bacterium]